jgi:hypothetical protein
MRWLQKYWYEYLFSDLDNCYNMRQKIRRIWCRIHGHKFGEAYHSGSLTALEPDYHCSHCGDEL